MKIAFCNGKGGSGKTTLSVLLGAALVEAGHRVAVKDTDPQRTATKWIEEIGGLELAKAREQYGATMIDTPPRLESREMSDAIKEADVVVLVTSPSPADLFTSRDTAALIQKLGAEKRSKVLYNQVQPGTILSRDLEDTASRIGLPAFKTIIRRRQAYQHAVLMGWRSLPAEAREELLKAALEIITSGKSEGSKKAK